MGKNQEERVLNYIKQFGSISSLEAFKDLGVTRLSAVVFCLRRKGYRITSTSEMCKNRYGETAHFARYKLVGE